MSDLVHLIYASKASSRFSKDDLLVFLEKSRRNNASLNVTGILIFDSGSFLQVLEGQEETLDKLYAVISNDDRHESIVKIISEAIPRRQFNRWSMGYSFIPNSELKMLEGMNDFFTDKTCLADIDESRAKKF